MSVILLGMVQDIFLPIFFAIKRISYVVSYISEEDKQ